MKISPIVSGIFFLSYLSLVSAHAIQVRHTPSAKSCKDYKIPVTVTSTVYTLDYAHFEDSYDVVDFAYNLTRRDSTLPIVGAGPATKSYTIGATFCTPTKSHGKEKIVLIATAGLGFDRR
jgi:hypothetical protein